MSTKINHDERMILIKPVWTKSSEYMKWKYPGWYFLLETDFKKRGYAHKRVRSILTKIYLDR